MLWIVMLTLAACAPAPAPAAPLQRVALLAPFEGRYREIGYDALYPLRLALSDTGSPLTLISVDDGGTPQTAAVQARRLAADPSILAALVIGPNATQAQVIAAFEDVPVVVIGHWGAQPAENAVILAAEKLPTLWTIEEQDVIQAAQRPSPLIGGEIIALKQYPLLRADTTQVTVTLSAMLPDSLFNNRLSESALYVPTAGALALVTYDAGGLLNAALSGTHTRADALQALRTAQYDGLNGPIRFDSAGWWANAPIQRYRYQGSTLTPVRGP
jgi:hypothetical protein